jgi:hypothetical protein
MMVSSGYLLIRPEKNLNLNPSLSLRRLKVLKPVWFRRQQPL